MKKSKESHTWPLVLSVIGFILALIAAAIGWMGWGGYILGIPAIILVIISLIYRGGSKLILGLSIVTLIFGGIGIAETTGGLIFVSGLEEVSKQTFGPSSVEEGASFNMTNYDLLISNGYPVLKINFNSNFDGYMYLYNGKEEVDHWPFSKEDVSHDFDLSSYGCNAKSGTYTLKVFTIDKNLVKTMNFTINRKVKIDDVKLDVINETFTGLELRSIKVKITNYGNVPVQVTYLSYILNGEKKEDLVWKWIVPANSTKEFVDSDLYQSLDTGDKITKIELEDDCGEVLATYSLNYVAP